MPIPLVRLNARVSRTYMPSFIKFMPAAQWSRHSCLQFNKLVNTEPTPKPAATDCIRWDFHGSIVRPRLMNNCATKQGVIGAFRAVRPAKLPAVCEARPVGRGDMRCDP